VNEHIIRAITSRLAFYKYGTNGYQDAAQKELANGFSFVAPLAKSLERYEKSRKKYPTFESFYGELLKSFAKAGESKSVIPIINIINSNQIIIAPSGEKDSSVQRRLNEFIVKFKNRLNADVPIITDQEALQKDLSDVNLVVFGTTDNNAWLRKNISVLPIRISPDKIKADKDYHGDSLRLISSWFNPQNQKRYMIIYSAQQAGDVIDITRVFHGGSNFIIAKGTSILKSGYYIFRKDKWTCF
jgi:hypothetical protein